MDTVSKIIEVVKIFQEDAKEGKMGRTELATTTVPTVITELNQVGPGAVVDFCWLLVLYIFLRFVSKLLTPLLVSSTSAIARSTLSFLKATFPETEYARRRRQYALPFLVNSEEGLRLTVAILKAITD